MIEAGIIGGAGYTAGELIRLLIHHPYVSIKYIYSTSNAGNKVSHIHQDLIGSTHLIFSGEVHTDVDVVFLCLGHGNSKAFLEQYSFSEQTVIIDLSNDFRLKEDADFQGRGFVYGLPELYKAQIKQAGAVANPGCFATAIQLALLPLANTGLIQDDVHINAVTGATGAGTSLSATSHYAWRDNNFSYYKAFKHQHLGEIQESLNSLQPKIKGELLFLPNRGNFSRGIFATAYTKYTGDIAALKEQYQEFYKDASFTFIADNPLHLKQVVNTNKCLIHIYQERDKVLITSIIDNLLKGASGQAVENMNLIFGLPQDTGLQLKATYF